MSPELTEAVAEMTELGPALTATEVLSPPILTGIPTGIPTGAEIMGRAAGENFPVAIRLLSPATRGHLLAIYGFARLVDQLGDEAPGDRAAHLDWLEGELDRAVQQGAVQQGAVQQGAVHPVMVRLSETIGTLALPTGPFMDLIEANRRDQRVARYERFDDLVDYCGFSANPVGRLVLAVFGASNPERQLLSDRVCTALQVIEHAQDVGEDARRGRIYLPQVDLRRFGCAEEELLAASAGSRLRSVIVLQAARARYLLGAAKPLVACLRGTARLAVAGFAAGGLAALDAIEAADFDVLGVACRPAVARTAFHACQLLASSARPARLALAPTRPRRGLRP